MSNLIYFKNKAIVKNFVGDMGEFVSKPDFASDTERYMGKIAVCHGLSNYGEIKICKRFNIDYIYIDNAYFGTMNSYYTMKKAKKMFYRVVKNGTTLTDIIERSDDRLLSQLALLNDEYQVTNYLEDFKTSGNKILLIPPTGMILPILNLKAGEWEEKASKIISSQTDMEIVIRGRARSRHDRFVGFPLHQQLLDAYGIVTLSSAAANEALIFGVPSFIHAKFSDKNAIRSAAVAVSGKITDINNRIFPENRYEWLSHLAYGQFSREEMSNGFARDFIIGA